MIEEGAAHFITINLYTANDVTVPCESGWTPFVHTGQCYKLFRLGRNWAAARAYCQGINGGDLASIPDQETNELIMSLLPQSGTYWIGGTDAASEGVWQWSDGTPWVYTNWRSGQPDNSGGGQHYLFILGPGEVHGQWSDYEEYREMWSICQY